jgi:polyhydroxyalkanoate synthesis regulator phasin
VKDDISAMETKTNAGQEELRQEISAFQERIKAGQAEFEERVTCTLDTQLKSVTTRVEQQAQELRDDFSKEIQVTRDETRNLHEDFRKEIQATRQDIIDTSQRDWEATARDLESRVPEVDTRTRRTVNGNIWTNAGQVIPPKFDGTTPWSAILLQFETAADNNGWTPGEKAAHLLNALQGRAVDILQCPNRSYLRGHRRGLQPAAPYRSHLKARTQANGETLQEFAAAIEM